MFYAQRLAKLAIHYVKVSSCIRDISFDGHKRETIAVCQSLSSPASKHQMCTAYLKKDVSLSHRVTDDVQENFRLMCLIVTKLLRRTYLQIGEP